jgi:ABC-type uncharacterized transport system permease subunit
MKDQYQPLIKDSAAFLLKALLLIALALIFILIFIPGSSNTIFSRFFSAAFRSGYHLGNFVHQSSLLLLGGLAVYVAFSSGVFNLGGEGQVYIGALAAGMLGLIPLDLPLGSLAILMLIAGAAAGASIAWISAWAKRSIGADELITSYLISQGLILLIDGLINSRLLRDADSFLMTTRTIAPAFRLHRILPPSSANTSLLIILAILVLLILLHRRKIGLEHELSGAEPDFARFSGIAVGRYRYWSMLLSGALYGIIGAIIVSAEDYALLVGATAGFGWNGIAVALIAGLKLQFLPMAAFFYSFLLTGTRANVLSGGLSLNFSLLLQAIVFLLVTADAKGPLAQKLLQLQSRLSTKLKSIRGEEAQ